MAGRLIAFARARRAGQPPHPCFLEPALARALDRGLPVDRLFLLREDLSDRAANDAHLKDQFDRVAAEGPAGPRDLVVIDRSTEVGAIRSRMPLWRAGAAAMGIAMDRIVYVSQNPGAALPPGRPGPRWLGFHHFALLMAQGYAATAGDFGYDAAGAQVLCLNGKHRAHRLALAQEARAVLGDRLLLSWRDADWPPALSAYQSLFPLTAARDLPRPDPCDLPGSLGLRPPVIDQPGDALRASTLHLVAETDVGAGVRRFTEKALKPIAVHRPFVIFGVPGVLALLRDCGFATFGGILDESYDGVQDPQARLLHIALTLRRAAALPPEELRAAARPVCAHNQAHLRRGLAPFLLHRFQADLAALCRPDPAAAPPKGPA